MKDTQDHKKNPFLVIGAGHQGLAMAAHFALNRELVYLWNRSSDNIAEVRTTKQIECEGIIRGKASIGNASSDLSEVITDTIFVTIPSSGHKDVARLLAPVILPNTIVYLNPGRTFGAIDFLQELKREKCKNLPIVAETQSIVYTCRRSENKAFIYALKNNVPIAYIGDKGKRSDVIGRIPECIRDRYTLVDSVLETSLGNIGMILHCAPVLLNAGWIECSKYDFLYYYDGITSSIGNILEQMDAERVNVANCLGIKVASLVEWFHRTYGVEGDSITTCIRNNDSYRKIDAPRSLSHRYLEEDIPNGLVPLEYLASTMGIKIPVTSMIIDLAQIMRGKDYRSIGRQFSADELKQFV